jgi:hypothetical protein
MGFTEQEDLQLSDIGHVLFASPQRLQCSSFYPGQKGLLRRGSSAVSRATCICIPCCQTIGRN